MNAWVSAFLDIALIALVVVGLVQVTRLMRHLAELKKSRGEMEKFVREFNATVLRAENGIKNLRGAARDSGDDLEKLVDRAGAVRDELNFLVESADQLATRLTQTASQSISARPSLMAQATEAVPTAEDKKSDAAPSSRAEKELLQALQKMKG